MSAPLLEVTGLSAWYGRAQALFGLSLTVHEGEAVALLGRNGAGKSTTLRAMMGLLPETRGERRFRGTELDRWAPHRIARLGLGLVPEDRRIFRGLTVAENLLVGRQPPRPEGLAPWTPARLFTLFPALEPLVHRRGGQLSGGEQQMLAIARTLMGNPTLLLLDEPSEGLAPRVVADLLRALQGLKREGLALLLSEQSGGFAAALCDRAYVLAEGTLRAEGPPAAVLADETVRSRWLAA